MVRKISVLWVNSIPEGKVNIKNGTIDNMVIAQGKGNCNGSKFSFPSYGDCRLDIYVSDVVDEPGPGATLVTVASNDKPFTFFLRDVDKNYPIYIRAYNVIVTEADDKRTYNQIAEGIDKKGLQTSLQKINSEPEESYETAIKGNMRRLGPSPIWLGLSRDVRAFNLNYTEYFWNTITPKFHYNGVQLEETSNNAVYYSFYCGRSCGCELDLTKHIENGVLPIFHAKTVDGDISYNITAFALLEKNLLGEKTVRGTDFLVASSLGMVSTLTEGEKKTVETLLPGELNREEETVLYCRIEAVNTSSAPCYAWFKTLEPQSASQCNYNYDNETGFSSFDSGRVYCITTLNGRPAPNEELAVLVKPHQSAVFEFRLPHCPVSKERAVLLSEQSFDEHIEACRGYWKSKLEKLASIKLPETRIDEMIRAGVLHLDMTSYGLEPEGPVAPSVGADYPPIGTESAPITQFLDSMGWHDLAERALMFFLCKQREDGFMQNFHTYMAETGAVLWSIGEHYRYTHNIEWIRQIKPKLMKACEYLINWIDRNKKDEFKGICYGMIEGQVADPLGDNHSFMLNGYAYIGLSRVAEMLSGIDPQESERIKSAAVELKDNIRSGFFNAIAESPVIPLKDGSWCPSLPPWTGCNGSASLYYDGGKGFSNCSFMTRDLLGPNWLVCQEVLDPNEPAVDLMLNYFCDMMTTRNVAFMQPYYSPHPWIHLRRGEVKPFLKAYYNEFSSIADRETYTFWECYYHMGVHKTHEEGWFLMRTRWMLYLENGNTLSLMSGIPRAWLENGKTIELVNVASYFGPITVHLESKLDQGYIEARIECKTDRKPDCVEIRIPHPEGEKAFRTSSGVYDEQREAVIIQNFDGYAEIKLEWLILT